jgi:hypothetical protein
MSGVIIANETHLTVPKRIAGLSAEYIDLKRESLFTPYGLFLPLDIVSFNVWNLLVGNFKARDTGALPGILRGALLRHDGTLYDVKLIPEDRHYVNATIPSVLPYSTRFIVMFEVRASAAHVAMHLSNDDIKGALDLLSQVSLIRTENYDILPMTELCQELKRRRCFKNLPRLTRLSRL